MKEKNSKMFLLAVLVLTGIPIALGVIALPIIIGTMPAFAALFIIGIIGCSLWFFLRRNTESDEEKLARIILIIVILYLLGSLTSYLLDEVWGITTPFLYQGYWHLPW